MIICHHTQLRLHRDARNYSVGFANSLTGVGVGQRRRRFPRMMNRLGLERFKKAQSAEPFSVKASSATLVPPQPDFQVPPQPQGFTATRVSDASALAVPAVATSTLGAGGSHWQPPDWAVDPKAGVYWLDVLKDGEVVDKISLDRRRCIFGRQSVMCDIVLDHPSVSRQHAAIVQHKNGGYVFRPNAVVNLVMFI